MGRLLEEESFLMKEILPEAGENGPPGHEFISPRNGERDEGPPAVQRQEEPAPLERLGAAVPGPRALGEDQVGIALFPHQVSGPIYALFAAPDALAVNGDETDKPHALPEDGDAKNHFLQDDPDGLRDEQEEQRPVEEAQMVGHEDIRRPPVDCVPAGAPDLYSQDGGGQADGPLSDAEQRIAQPQRPSDEEQDGQHDNQNEIDENQEEGPHVRLPGLYHNSDPASRNPELCPPCFPGRNRIK